MKIKGKLKAGEGLSSRLGATFYPDLVTLWAVLEPFGCSRNITVILKSDLVCGCDQQIGCSLLFKKLPFCCNLDALLLRKTEETSFGSFCVSYAFIYANQLHLKPSNLSYDLHFVSITIERMMVYKMCRLHQIQYMFTLFWYSESMTLYIMICIQNDTAFYQ